MIPRTIVLPLLAAMGISSCSKISKAGFWSWFESRESEFAQLFSYDAGTAAQDDVKLQEKIEGTVAEVGAKLREVHAEFSPFFGFSGGVNQMTITVHGQPEHFKAVDEFIASAPKIGGWKFIALKQPLSLSTETEISSGSAKLKVGDWRYMKSRNSHGTFDFVIYVPNQVSDDPAGFKRLFIQLTRDFLGERFASTIVGDVTVRQSIDAKPEGLLPFVDIYKDVSQANSEGASAAAK